MVERKTTTGELMSRKLKDFFNKLKYLQNKLPEEYNAVLQSGANYFVNTAVRLTDKEKLVDTGNYRRRWGADVLNNSIEYFNSADYASHLEFGHKIHGTNRRIKGYFVGTKAVRETRNYILKKLKARFKHLYKKR